MRQRLAVVFFVFSFMACANVQVFQGVAADTLYFGTQIPAGGVVSDAEWQQFLADVITPRFPDGFTTWEANGQWRDQKGVIEREHTHIVQIVKPDEVKIREIIDIYKKQFHQEAVMCVSSEVGLAFR